MRRAVLSSEENQFTCGVWRKDGPRDAAPKDPEQELRADERLEAPNVVKVYALAALFCDRPEERGRVSVPAGVTRPEPSLARQSTESEADKGTP